MKEPSESELSELPDPVRWSLERADGYLDLHMPERARRELDSVPEAARDSVPFRQVSLRLAMDVQEWPTAAALAERLRRVKPNDPEFWILEAYAVRRTAGLEAARSILEEATPRFPKLAVIPFNRACYECRLGRYDEALRLLQQAFRLDPTYREMAQEDEDLEPLWERLSS